MRNVDAWVEELQGGQGETGRQLACALEALKEMVGRSDGLEMKMLHGGLCLGAVPRMQLV